jgi:hypothetical protein
MGKETVACHEKRVGRERGKRERERDDERDGG